MKKWCCCWRFVFFHKKGHWDKSFDFPLLPALLVLSRIQRGLPRWCSWSSSRRQCRSFKRCRSDPWVGKLPWREAWHPTPVFLPGGPLGQRSLAGYSPQGHKESDTTERARIHVKAGLTEHPVPLCGAGTDTQAGQPGLA